MQSQNITKRSRKVCDIIYYQLSLDTNISTKLLLPEVCLAFCNGKANLIASFPSRYFVNN